MTGFSKRGLGAVRRMAGFDKPVDVVAFLKAVLSEEADWYRAKILNLEGTAQQRGEAVMEIQGATDLLRDLGRVLGYVEDRALGRPLPEPAAPRSDAKWGYD